MAPRFVLPADVGRVRLRLSRDPPAGARSPARTIDPGQFPAAGRSNRPVRRKAAHPIDGYAGRSSSNMYSSKGVKESGKRLVPWRSEITAEERREPGVDEVALDIILDHPGKPGGPTLEKAARLGGRHT